MEAHEKHAQPTATPRAKRDTETECHTQAPAWKRQCPTDRAPLPPPNTTGTSLHHRATKRNLQNIPEGSIHYTRRLNCSVCVHTKEPKKSGRRHTNTFYLHLFNFKAHTEGFLFLFPPPKAHFPIPEGSFLLKVHIPKAHFYFYFLPKPPPSGDLRDQMNSDPSALALRARATAYTCTPLPAEHTAHRSEQGEPLILTNLSTMRQPVLGGQIMQLRDPSAPARWTADRACGAWARNPKPGKSEATRAGLTTAHALTMACATPGCQALVDLLAARRQARAGSIAAQLLALKVQLAQARAAIAAATPAATNESAVLPVGNLVMAVGNVGAAVLSIRLQDSDTALCDDGATIDCFLTIKRLHDRVLQPTTKSYLIIQIYHAPST